MTSRRTLLKTAVAAPAALGSVYAYAKQEPAAPLPKTWDMEVEVAIAGSGIAGMSAAIELLDHGIEPAVFEMSENYGGCAYVCGGYLMLEGGTRTQLANGIKDTPDAFYKRLTDPKNPEMRKNEKNLARAYADILPGCQVWLEERGVKFSDKSFTKSGFDTQHPGQYHHVLWHEPGEPKVRPIPGGYMVGMGFMIPLRKYYEGKGGKILFKHKLLDVYRDASGRVVGARIDNEGKIINVRAKKAVVLAGGSWKANKKLRKLTDPRFGEDMFSSGYPYVKSDGSAILAGLRAGAMYIADRGQDRGHMRRKFGTSRYDWNKNSKYGRPGIECDGMRWAQIIFTNKNGDRFIKEVDKTDLGGYWFYDLALEQPGQIIWTIFDDKTAKKNRWSVKEPICEKGYAFSAPTLEELAKTTGQPNLVKTVARYNKFVDAKKDEDFDKPADMLTTKIEQGPFYAVRCVLGVHNLTGGLHINEHGQVLDLNGEVIEGLYAAGETTGGLFHSAAPRCMATGRLAGQWIASH